MRIKYMAEMAVWKYGRMSVLKDRSMKERKDGSSRKTEGWDGPSRPPYISYAGLVVVVRAPPL